MAALTPFKSLLFGFLFVFGATSALFTSSVWADSSQIAAELGELMTSLHDDGKFNGAIVVGMGREVVYDGGFGFANVEENIRFGPETPTWCASLAKTFTAAAVLKLGEEQLLDLDDPVAKYLTEFPYEAITVRHLLSHSSGLLPTDIYFAGIDLGNETRTNRKLLKLIAQRRPPLPFKPGEAFQYSNAAYDLAALLIETVSGQSYAEYVDDNIFEKLGMESTFVRPAWNRDWSRGTRTLSYHGSGDQRRENEVPDNRADYGSDGFYSSARDLYRWASSFYLGSPLSHEVIQSGLDAPHLGPSHVSRLNLLNWYYSEGGNQFYFTGDGQGFYTFVYWDLDRQISIVWVTNEQSPLPPPVLTRAIFDIVEGRQPSPVTVPDYAPSKIASGTAWPTVKELAAYSGRWRLGDGSQLMIGIRDEVTDLRAGWPLFARIDDGIDYHIFPAGPMLYVPGVDAFVWFERETGEQRIYWAQTFVGVLTGTLEKD